MIRRREFITVLGGTAAAWPVAAQQAERMRRVGALMSVAGDDPEGQARFVAFRQGLQQLGWADGSNMRMDVRWGAGDSERIRQYAAELVALAPDVIHGLWWFSDGTVAATRTVAIVFTQTPDPVGAGFVDSLPRPGGNATGFTLFEYDMGAKWLEVLKDIAPNVTRAAVLRDPAIPQGAGQWGAIQTAASSFRVEVTPINVRDVGEIERTVGAFARLSNGGLVVTGRGLALVHRNLIVTLAARHRLPAVYPLRAFVAGGGLISYGANALEQHHRAAQNTSIAFSRARSPLTCRCRRRPSTSWSSTSRRPRRSPSTCRPRSSPAPTR
jgi:putative ABC transport system substrate-binding protein